MRNPFHHSACGLALLSAPSLIVPPWLHLKHYCMKSPLVVIKDVPGNYLKPKQCCIIKNTINPCFMYQDHFKPKIWQLFWRLDFKKIIKRFGGLNTVEVSRMFAISNLLLSKFGITNCFSLKIMCWYEIL